MHPHLVLFDGECPFCHRAVRHIIGIDSNFCFLFSPLKGEKAKEILGDLYDSIVKADTLVLVENYVSKNRRIWIRSRAILRIYWLVGHRWKVFGLLSFLPGWGGDLAYRLFAICRYQFNVKMTKEPISENRFLP